MAKRFSDGVEASDSNTSKLVNVACHSSTLTMYDRLLYRYKSTQRAGECWQTVFEFAFSSQTACRC
jgi:hypothetical protein